MLGATEGNDPFFARITREHYAAVRAPHPKLGAFPRRRISRVTVLTISAGVRWTRVLELYLAPKIGIIPCP